MIRLIPRSQTVRNGPSEGKFREQHFDRLQQIFEFYPGCTLCARPHVGREGMAKSSMAARALIVEVAEDRRRITLDCPQLQPALDRPGGRTHLAMSSAESVQDHAIYVAGFQALLDIAQLCARFFQPFCQRHGVGLLLDDRCNLLALLQGG